MSKRRGIPEINAGSMADIAFLLLIFFLVTTTMDTDTGLTRKLPPPLPEEQEPPDIKKRNIFQVLVNANDQLLVEDNPMLVTQLREETKKFIKNEYNKEGLPEKEPKQIPYFGTYMVSKGIVSLQNDRGTSYEMYIKVQNELVGAYTELRNELAEKKFGKKFDDLPDAKQDAIKDVYPQRISEAEPKNIGSK